LVVVLGVAAAATVPSSVAAARPVLVQPYDLQPLPNGRFLVTDLPGNAVYELDPVRKTGRLIARVDQARELSPLAPGRVLVSSGERVLVLNLRTHRTSVYATAQNYLLGIALAPDGWLYASENVFGSEQTTLVRIRGGTREVLGTFHGVHGILPVADGLILSESFGGRVLHFDPETKAAEVLATGLKNPSFTLPAASGGYYKNRSRPRADHLPVAVRRGRDTRAVIREEFRRLWGWEERHRRLVARIGIALLLTLIADVIGAFAIWLLERHARGTDIHTVGDAFFFASVQLLTISSQLKNPLTAGGRVVDVALEAWALIVVASVAGSFASFFATGDRA
jgi:hypothetical protein